MRHVTHERLQYFCKTQTHTHTRARKRRQHREWIQCLVVQLRQKRRHVTKWECYLVWEMSVKCCRIDNVVSPSGGKQNNAITGICKHLGARTHTSDFQLQHVFPQTLFCTLFPQFNYLPRTPILPRFCRPLIRHLLYILQPTITDITLSRITPAPPYCHPDYELAPRKTTKKVKKVNIVGPYIPYGLFQTKGEMCAKFGSDWFRNVNLYKVQTNKQTHTHKLTLSFIHVRYPNIQSYVTPYIVE
jgi:hypothetical protein